MPSEPALSLLSGRLDEAEIRLNRRAASGPVAGLTRPDRAGGERWDAGQVWAHLAEFPAYWLGEAERIVNAASGESVSFGRATDAPVRTLPIEAERHRPVAELWADCRAGIERVRAFARITSDEDWARLGDHVTKGPTSVGFVLEAFVGGHLLEHAAQLEELQD